jgi:hypothetical protein
MTKALRDREDGLSSDRLGNFVMHNGDLVTSMERGAAFGGELLTAHENLFIRTLHLVEEIFSFQ